MSRSRSKNFLRRQSNNRDKTVWTMVLILIVSFAVSLSDKG